MTPKEIYQERRDAGVPIGGFPPGNKRYRLIAGVSLPLRLGGAYSYRTAYRLACEWNRAHNAEEMARIVEKRDA